MSSGEAQKNNGSPKECDHTSVGMLVIVDRMLLLIERGNRPFGFAPPAGHVDDHGSFEDAARRELAEEVGFKAVRLDLIIEGRRENNCRRLGGTWHYWKIYFASVTGKELPSAREVKQIRWCTKADLRKLIERTELYLAGSIDELEWEKEPGIEPVWYEWFGTPQLRAVLQLLE